MKNILYLSYDGLTDPLGQSQILPYIIELSKLGFSFSIISFEKKVAAYSESEILEQMAPYSIDWYPLSYTKQPPVLATVWDVFRLSKKVQSLLKKKEISLIHCRSYITSLIGIQVKNKFGIPFIFDMRGFWADERVDGGIWNLKNPIFNLVYKYFKQKERQFCQFSDAIISLTNAGKNEMETWQIDYISKKINIIPCAVDTVHFQPSEELDKQAEDLKKKLFPKNSKVLLYSGSLGTWYLLKEMLNFYYMLHEKDSSWHFLLLTRDIDKINFETENISNEVKNKIQYLEVKRDHIPKYISIADFTIFFITPKFSKKSSFPTKHAEFMAMGKPSIANSNVGDVESIINESNSGVVLTNFCEREIENKIKEVLSFKGNNLEISNFAEKRFSLSSAVAKYQTIYSSILSEK